MAHATRASEKRRRGEDQERHIAETTEVGDSLCKWIMLNTSGRPDDFLTEDVMLRIMGKFHPADDRTTFLKRYRKNLTDVHTISATDYSARDLPKLLRCLAAKARVERALSDLVKARIALDVDVKSYIDELKSPTE